MSMLTKPFSSKTIIVYFQIVQMVIIKIDKTIEEAISNYWQLLLAVGVIDSC